MEHFEFDFVCQYQWSENELLASTMSACILRLWRLILNFDSGIRFNLNKRVSKHYANDVVA